MGEEQKRTTKEKQPDKEKKKSEVWFIRNISSFSDTITYNIT